MQQQLQSMSDFQHCENKKDGLQLLNLIRDVVFYDESRKYHAASLHENMKTFYNLRQGRYTAVRDYHKSFTNLTKAIESQGGNVSLHKGVYEEILNKFKVSEPNKLSNDDKKKYGELAKQQYLRNALLAGADVHRFGKLYKTLHNDYLMGMNNYPKNIVEAYNLLIEWRDENIISQNFSNDGVAFTNVAGSNEANTDDQGGTTLVNTGGGGARRRDKSHITCYGCNEKGHYQNECPNKEKKQEAEQVIPFEQKETSLIILSLTTHSYKLQIQPQESV